MYKTAASVPQAIREVLSSNGLYLQALKSGIANYTALAQRIKSDVETIIGAQVNVGTIVVAIKRLSDILEKEKQEEQKKSINTHPMDGARMSLTGSIIDIDFDRELDELSNILDEVFEKESGYNLFQTNKQLRLFTEDIDEIRNIVSTASKKFDFKLKEGLSKITINFPSSTSYNNEQTPYNDVLSLVSDVLYNNQIPLYNAFFAPNETVLILKNKDAARAYELLRAKITKQ
jgi:cation transport regulator ChaB